MKKTRNTRVLQPALCLAALLLAGCSGEDGNGGRGAYRRTAIVPTATVSLAEPSRGDAPSGPFKGESFPKGTGNLFAVTDYRSGGKPTSKSDFDYGTAYFHNQSVSSDAGGRMGFDTPQYYPTDGKLYFYAYSPVMPEATSPSDNGYRKGSAGTPPTVTFDISDGKTDILWASDDNGIAWADGKKVTQQQHPGFQFSHKLQLIRFKLVRGSDFPSGWKVGTIVVQGNPQNARDDANKLKERATLDLTNGTVAYTSNSKDGNFSHKVKNDGLWSIDSRELDASFLIRPVQRLSLSFVVDTDPAHPGQNTRKYSTEVVLDKTKTDVGGRNYLITATFGGGIDVDVTVEEGNGWHPCGLDKQTIGK